MSNNKYDYIYEEFRKMCPWAVPNVVGWRLYSEEEILVNMSDGTTMTYDYIYKAFRVYKNEEEIRQRRQPNNEVEWKKQFAIRLHKKMIIAGYNQEYLSYDSGISQASINKYLNCQATPTAWSLVRIAEVLKCSVEELVKFD